MYSEYNLYSSRNRIFTICDTKKIEKTLFRYTRIHNNLNHKIDKALNCPKLTTHLYKNDKAKFLINTQFL